jgi:Fic family protein
MKKELLDFIDKLMKHDEDFTNSIITDEIKNYLELLASDKSIKSEVTDSGKIILKHMQDNNVTMAKAKDIASALGMSSRAVSGSLRKLVTDGYVEKIGENPTIYAISEKGKNYKID